MHSSPHLDLLILPVWSHLGLWLQFHLYADDSQTYVSNSLSCCKLQIHKCNRLLDDFPWMSHSYLKFDMDVPAWYCLTSFSPKSTYSSIIHSSQSMTLPHTCWLSLQFRTHPKSFSFITFHTYPIHQQILFFQYQNISWMWTVSSPSLLLVKPIMFHWDYGEAPTWFFLPLHSLMQTLPRAWRMNA